MTWRIAFTNLAALPVTGVATRYDLNTLPNMLPASDLPALAPGFAASAGLIEQGAEGFSTLTYDGGVWKSVLYVEHLLYWSPAWSQAGLNAVLPDLLVAVDNYLSAIQADGRLGGALQEETQITHIQPGVIEYAGVSYYGVRFRHRWVRVV
jgi:hypothetical protein